MTKDIKALILALSPFAIFGILYFLLGLYPNYMVAPIDTAGIYNLEKSLFGISTAAGTITPNEYFAIHNWPLTDALSGILYMCWVPLPILFCIWLFFTGRRTLAMHVSSAFLMVNLFGFAGYYIHPSSPPWYVMDYGFEPIFDTGGSAAGFSRFDTMFGTTFFHDFYVNNQNVFAAIPSLHSAYNPIAFWYSLRLKGNWAWKIILAIVSIGIWFTAVYTAHHYIIDVILGILCSVIGIAFLDKVCPKVPAFKIVQKYVTSVLNV